MCQLQQTLDIPPISDVKLTLKARGAIVSPSFRIEIKLEAPGFPGHLLRWGKRIGPWVRTSRGVVRLTLGQGTLLDRLEQPWPSSVENRITQWAQIRPLAIETGTLLDPYLQREQYRLIDHVGAAVQPAFGDRLEIQPIYEHADISTTVLNELARQDSRYFESRQGTQRERIIVQHQVAETLRQMQASIPNIQGQDIPRFLLNPETFIPENWPIDLQKFSDRVRGLKIRIYRAQPFVHAKTDDRGWFEIQTGLELNPLTPDAEPDSIEMNTNWSPPDESDTHPGEFIKTDQGWVQLPHNYFEIKDALNQAQSFQGKTVDPTSLPYILDIFNNLDNVDYNQPFWDIKQNQIQSHALNAPPPNTFLASLHTYQKEGFIWLKQRYHYRVGGLLADDMGLGKTVQVLAFLSYLSDKGWLRPTLVVAPVALIRNWLNELNKFAPTIHGTTFYGPSRIKDIPHLMAQDVVFSTYETISRDQLLLGQVDWQGIIVDEAQWIKNSSTRRTEALKALKNRFRVAMTGTPVENSLLDLWSIIDFVQPGLLGSQKEFREQYQNDRELGKERVQPLIDRLSLVYKRRTKEEVRLDLPEKTIHQLLVPMGDKQRHIYQTIARSVQQKSEHPLSAVRKLQLVLGHPSALSESPDWSITPPAEVPKLHQTLNILSEIQKLDEKVLIFSPNRPLQSMLRHWIMTSFDLSPLVINGDVSDRQALVDRFNTAIGFHVMILSPHAGGVGLTITGANHVIHYTRWWNPATENQATDRVHRLGQNRPVYVYYPIVVDQPRVVTERGTLEEIIAQLLDEKQSLAQNIVIPSASMNIERDLIQAMFRP